MTFWAEISIDQRQPISSLGSKNDRHSDQQEDPTIYLFIRPLTRLSEVEDWLNGEPFFWSLDENGTTQIPESTREQLGLPTLTPCQHAEVDFWSWPKYTYDVVYKWQVAKGFDPSTLDFAHSLGRPLFDSDTPEQSRSEEVVKEESEKPIESESPTTSDFDESFLSRLSKLSWWQAADDIPAFG
ncbi:hypothetical protein VNI00_000455 [Paramarasmius palmivorus]|uniref:Uncharacterized protein n=1 Tax=Paramarasmius palmivorus TaxID=297713 RepID=A0AAW0EA21_9AGAR